jgi:hypothetical protein
MQLPQSHPKSAVIDMEPSATRLHLPGLSLEHRHQTFSTLFGNHDAELAHRPNGVGCILSGPRSSQALSDRKQLDAELLLNPLCKHKEIWRLVESNPGNMVKLLEMHVGGYQSCVLYSCTPAYSPELEFAAHSNRVSAELSNGL